MRQQRFSNFQITIQLIVFFQYIFFSLQFTRSFGWGQSQKMFKNQRTYSQNFCYYFGLYHIPTSHDTLKYIKHCYETIYLVNVRGHFDHPSIVSPLLVSCARRPPPTGHLSPVVPCALWSSVHASSCHSLPYTLLVCGWGLTGHSSAQPLHCPSLAPPTLKVYSHQWGQY